MAAHAASAHARNSGPPTISRNRSSLRSNANAIPRRAPHERHNNVFRRTNADRANDDTQPQPSHVNSTRSALLRARFRPSVARSHTRH